MTDSVETLGVDLRARVNRPGFLKKKNKKVKWEVRFWLMKEEPGFPTEVHEGGSQEVLTSRSGASKNVGEDTQWRWSLQKD